MIPEITAFEQQLLDDAHTIVMGLARLSARAKSMGMEMDVTGYTSGDRYDINFKRVLVDFNHTVSTDD